MIRRSPPSPHRMQAALAPCAPYPLLDFETGLYDAKESWLAPRGALDVLENAHVFRGRIHKRRGHSKLGPLGTEPGVQTLTAITGSKSYGGTLPHTDIVLPKGPYAATIYSTGAAPVQTAYAGTARTGTGSTAVTDEKVTIPHGSFTGFSFTLTQLPVVAGSVVLKDRNGATIATDLGNGKFSGAWEPFPGSNFSAIDYTTGVGWILFPTAKLGPFYADYDFASGTLGEELLQDNLTTGLTPTTPTWAFSGGREIKRGTFDLTDSTGGTPLQITDDGEGNLVGPPGTTGTLDYATGTITGFALPGGWTNPSTLNVTAIVGYLDHATGVWFADFIAVPGGGGDIVAEYVYNRGLPVMGIRNFFDRAENEYVVALDTRRLFLWNPDRGYFVDQCEADVFTGDIGDFPWLEPFEDQLVITNGIDAPHKFVPATPIPNVTAMGGDFDGDASDELTSASIFLRGKDNSGIYLSTKEDGVAYPQRARFTQVNDIEFAAGSPATAELFADAPTEDEIVTAERLGDHFIVGFRRSFWLLQYTGDPLLPYEWKRIPMSEGAIAKKASVELAEEVITRGQTGIVAVDGVGEQPLDVAVPDIALRWDPLNGIYSQAFHSREARQVLLSFSDEEEYPTKALVLQYDDLRTRRSFAIYDFPFHSIGSYRRETTILWDDLTDLLDNYTFILDQASSRAGFPIVLVGDRTGWVHEWGLVNDDDGADIQARIRFTRLNPFPFQRAHLGYIDLLLANQTGLSLTLNVYADFASAPYFTTQIDTSGNAPASDGKVKRRVRINRIANWHSIELVETSKTPFALDALVPYFKSAGPMRNVSP